MRNWIVGAMVIALAAPAARAQGASEPQGTQAGTSDALVRACIDLMNGKVPEGGEQAVEALRTACGDLMQARAEEQQRAVEERERAREQRQAQAQARSEPRVEAGQATAQPQQGTGILAAFEQAGQEFVRRPAGGPAMGMRSGGPVSTTIVTNPIGWFSGLGVNAELHRAFQSNISWVAGGRYSRTEASNGNASTFGLMGGADLYVLGRNNEGLRIGPRLELAAGRENFQSSTNFARLGLAGEVGYNFIASNGITGMLAGGLGGRIAGDDDNEDFESFTGGEFGPYVKVGLGFSW